MLLFPPLLLYSFLQSKFNPSVTKQLHKIVTLQLYYLIDHPIIETLRGFPSHQLEYILFYYMIKHQDKISCEQNTRYFYFIIIIYLYSIVISSFIFIG